MMPGQWLAPCTITFANQEKGGLGRRWKAHPKVKLCRLISVTCFLVVFNHIQLCKIYCSSTYYCDLHSRKYNDKITKIWQPTLRAGNKSPALFLKKPLCTGNLLPTCKIFIERRAIVKFTLRTNFLQLLQFHLLFSASQIAFRLLSSSVTTFG